MRDLKPYIVTLNDEVLYFDNWHDCLIYLIKYSGIGRNLIYKIKKQKSPYYPTRKRLKYLTGLTITEGEVKDEHRTN